MFPDFRSPNVKITGINIYSKLSSQCIEILTMLLQVLLYLWKNKQINKLEQLPHDASTDFLQLNQNNSIMMKHINQLFLHL